MRIPSFYKISNKLTADELTTVQQILSYTPLDCAVVSKREDVPQAEQLSPLVLMSDAIPSLAGRARFAIVGEYQTPLTVVYDNEEKALLC